MDDDRGRKLIQDDLELIDLLYCHSPRRFEFVEQPGPLNGLRGMGGKGLDSNEITDRKCTSVDSFREIEVANRSFPQQNWHSKEGSHLRMMVWELNGTRIGAIAPTPCIPLGVMVAHVLSVRSVIRLTSARSSNRDRGASIRGGLCHNPFFALRTEPPGTCSEAAAW